MLANGFQGWHLVILVLVVVLLFGAKRLPDAARSLGKSMRIFKSEVKEMQADGKHDDATAKPAPSPTPIISERVGGPEHGDSGIRSETTPAPGPSTEQRPA
jgi:sec-independent protein translocase protein TatA